MVSRSTLEACSSRRSVVGARLTLSKAKPIAADLALNRTKLLYFAPPLCQDAKKCGVVPATSAPSPPSCRPSTARYRTRAPLQLCYIFSNRVAIVRRVAFPHSLGGVSCHLLARSSLLVLRRPLAYPSASLCPARGN